MRKQTILHSQNTACGIVIGVALQLVACTQNNSQQEMDRSVPSSQAPSGVACTQEMAKNTVIHIDTSTVTVGDIRIGSTGKVSRPGVDLPSLRTCLQAIQPKGAHLVSDPNVSMLKIDIILGDLEASKVETWDIQVGDDKAGPFRFLTGVADSSLEALYLGEATPRRMSVKQFEAGNQLQGQNIELIVDAGSKIWTCRGALFLLSGKNLRIRTHAGPF